jgi:uncharacterized membrane protein
MTRTTEAGEAPRWVQLTALALALGATAVAAYLTVTHYGDPAALACPDTGVVNCTLVTTSSWSVLLGVPVAVVGLAWALVMVGLTLPWAWRTRSVALDRARTAAAALGSLAVLYLVYVELFRIGAICLWCTAVHVLAVSLFALVLASRTARRDGPLPV